ncbi:MAG: hypothetical protein ACRD17_12455 [Terriglobales bacterium]
MFARRLHVSLTIPGAEPPQRRPCPLKYLDTFAMRSFTGESRFDETLPAADGILEASLRVPLPALRDALQDWFRRKGYLRPDEVVEIAESGH